MRFATPALPVLSLNTLLTHGSEVCRIVFLNITGTRRQTSYAKKERNVKIRRQTYQYGTQTANTRLTVAKTLLSYDHGLMR